MNRRIAFWLVLLSLLGFALRGGAVIALHSWRHPSAMEHRSLALSLIHGHGFSFSDFRYYGPSSVQSPPYPLLLAGLFKLLGPDSARAYAAAMFLNAAVGGLTVALTYLLARTLGGSQTVGLLAAGLVCLWPDQIYLATYAQAIALITAAIVGMMILFYRSVRTGRPGPWIGYCIVGSLAALTEPVLLPMLAFSGLLILLWRGRLWSVRLRNAAILLFAAAAVMPWTVRNRLVHGAWIPIKSTFWVNVWKGNNDFATGTDRLPLDAAKSRQIQNQKFSSEDEAMRDPQLDAARQYDRLTPQERARLQNQPEAKREKVFKDLATGWIAAHPARYVQLCFIRLGKTLWIDSDNPKSHSALYLIPHLLLQGMTLLGIFVAVGRRWSLLYPALLAGSCLLMYTLTVTAARFALPFEPLQLCLSAQFLVAAAQRLRGLQPQPAVQRTL